MYTRAIVRPPGLSFVKGLTTADLGIPDYHKALAQHRSYIDALERCGLEVLELEADERFPDSTFVEDVALLTPHCAIITNPGAPSRQGETTEIRDVLKEFYADIEGVREPGTVEAGDIIMAGSHFYIGLSSRTNIDGASQVIAALERYGMGGSVIKVESALHLKTGAAYIERNNLVACGEFVEKPEFQKYNILNVDEDEDYAANCVWVNDQVLVPEGYPKTRKIVEQAGYSVVELDTSEFRKQDGGLSCLSLRF